MTHESSVDEDERFAAMGKARHKRRLMDRWRCKSADHTYCFKEGDIVHVRLTEDDIDKWAEVVVRSDLYSVQVELFVDMRITIARGLCDSPSSTSKHRANQA